MKALKKKNNLLSKQIGSHSLFYYLNVLLAVIGFFAFIMLIMMAGFDLSEQVVTILNYVINLQILLFAAQEILRAFAKEKDSSGFFNNIRHYGELLLAAFLLAYLLFPNTIIGVFARVVPEFNKNDLKIMYLIVAQIPFLIVIVRKVLKYSQRFGRIQLHSGAIFMISFAILIFFGTFLFLLPKAIPSGQEHLSFIDALFTATSAVCVTGLSIIDPATQLSTHGQLFLISLVQIGALGVLTLTALFAMFANGGISFQIRVIMGDVLSDDNLSDVTSMIKRIILYTAVIEFSSAVIMYYALGGSFLSLDIPLFYASVFHSISAFCNAGFSNFEAGLMNPLLQNNYIFLTVIMVLITLGGIGFPVIQNILRLKIFKKGHKRIRYQLTITTKLVLITSAVLVFVPAVLIFIFEPMTFVLPEASNASKLFHSLFLSVTTRTAGFSIVPLELLHAPAVLIVIILMSIGASPGSTGGGMKNTTYVIAFMQFIRLLRGQERLILFNREIHRELVRKALLIMFTYAMLVFIGTFIIATIEPDFTIVDITFEVVSSLSTVGLSRNLTHLLSEPSKLVLIMCMFIGRIGVLTFFMAFHKPKLEPNIKLPKTNVMIG